MLMEWIPDPDGEVRKGTISAALKDTAVYAWQRAEWQHRSMTTARPSDARSGERRRRREGEKDGRQKRHEHKEARDSAGHHVALGCRATPSALDKMRVSLGALNLDRRPEAPSRATNSTTFSSPSMEHEASLSAAEVDRLFRIADTEDNRGQLSFDEVCEALRQRRLFGKIRGGHYFVGITQSSS